MVALASEQRFYLARSLSDALVALADRGAAGVPLAGATWVMRAASNGTVPPAYVGLTRIEALRTIEVAPDEVRIGACVTHAELAEALAGMAECRVLAEAAARSANPSVRTVATIGGNLCARDFAAADLVPALLCLGARVEVSGTDGSERLGLGDFLVQREVLAPGRILVRILVPRHPVRTAHARLPLRVAGDYPVAIVSLATRLDPAGRVEAAWCAVGSVEPVARRWPELEQRLVGQQLDPDAAAGMAKEVLGGFQGRDGVEADGAYRVRVLPALVRRAVAAAAA